MNKRFYWTALMCGALAIATPVTYAADHGDQGDGGGHSSDHGGASGDHGSASGDRGSANGEHGDYGSGFGGNFGGEYGTSHENKSEHKSEHVDKADASGKPSPADMIDRNTKLSDNLKADLPEGSDLKTEAEGFKNLGHFVAAVHVSKNLDVSFADLKAKMMAGDSLGQAIHALKPEVDSTKVADDALKQAGTEVTMQ
jgi:hypothetical protein